ncbi:unnamed protein product [Closterium sp. NIES-65]|nr:unnamed protein product [Closterium sp. NIES-65]
MTSSTSKSGEWWFLGTCVACSAPCFTSSPPCLSILPSLLLSTTPHRPELVGRTFGDALFLFDNATPCQSWWAHVWRCAVSVDNATPCGLMKAPKQHTAPDASGAAGSSMGEVLVNPPSWTLIEAPRQHSTPDASSAGSTMGEVLVNPPSGRSLARRQAPSDSSGPQQLPPGPSRLPPPPSELTAAAVPAATQKAPRGTSSSSVGGKQHVLICGWRPEAKQLVELLPSILAQGSEVTVVATHISPTDELLLGNIRRHKKLPIRISECCLQAGESVAAQQTGRAWQPSRPGGDGVPLPLETVDSGDSAAVNASQRGGEREDEEEDAGMAARGRAQEAAIVAEVPASERDVARQVERHALDGAVCPEHLEAQVLAQITHDPGEMGQAGHLEAQVLAQITHDPALCIPYLSTHPSSPFPSSPSPPLFLVVSTTARCWNDVGTVLDEIIGSERNRMAVRRADEFIGEHEAGIFNLWEMQARVRMSEELVIAYRHRGEWHLNPSNKDQLIPWGHDDRLLVIRASLTASARPAAVSTA